ncbi:hypothetical protein U1Q18_017917 [Sarracenia purpurea var. burkii]
MVRKEDNNNLVKGEGFKSSLKPNKMALSESKEEQVSGVDKVESAISYAETTGEGCDKRSPLSKEVVEESENVGEEESDESADLGAINPDQSSSPALIVSSTNMKAMYGVPGSIHLAESEVKIVDITQVGSDDEVSEDGASEPESADGESVSANKEDSDPAKDEDKNEDAPNEEQSKCSNLSQVSPVPREVRGRVASKVHYELPQGVYREEKLGATEETDARRKLVLKNSNPRLSHNRKGTASSDRTPEGLKIENAWTPSLAKEIIEEALRARGDLQSLIKDKSIDKKSTDLFQSEKLNLELEIRDYSICPVHLLREKMAIIEARIRKLKGLSPVKVVVDSVESSVEDETVMKGALPCLVANLGKSVAGGIANLGSPALPLPLFGNGSELETPESEGDDNYSEPYPKKIIIVKLMAL